MKEQFCSYEIALKLKELGFNEPCFFAFDNCQMRCTDLRTNEQKFSGVNYNSSNYISQPLWQQAESFLRTKILFHIIFREDGWYWEVLHKGHFSKNGNFKTYEEAQKQAILKAIELCQKEK